MCIETKKIYGSVNWSLPIGKFYISLGLDITYNIYYWRNMYSTTFCTLSMQMWHIRNVYWQPQGYGYDSYI